MIEKLINDLFTNPLFIIFTVIECGVFFGAVYYLYKSYKSALGVTNLIGRLKTYLEAQGEEGDDKGSNSEEITQKKSGELTQVIAKLINSSEKNEMEVDINTVERIIKHEIEKPQAFVRTSINILPVLGLIGTFVGIAISVYQLSFSSDITQIYETILSNLKSLNPFLDGIKLAFYTTILGLLLALILRIFSELSSTYSKNSIVDFLNYFTIELSEYIKPMGPADKIAKSITGFSKRVSRLSIEIEKSLNRIVENYSQTSKDQAQIFDKKMSELDDIQLNLLNNLNLLWGKINDTLTYTTEQVNKAAELYTKSNEKSIGLSEQLMPMIGQFQQVNDSQIDNTTKIGLAVRRLSEDNQLLINQMAAFIIPLDDLRSKYEEALKAAIELNIPFKETNDQLKERFELLVQSISSLQRENSSLTEKITVYAGSLESNLGAKLDHITAVENQGQLIMQSFNELQRRIDSSVEKLGNYALDLNKAGQLLVNNITTQLSTLFIDISNRQNIAISVVNTDLNNNNTEIEKILIDQNYINSIISKNLENLTHALNHVSGSLYKAPFFSIKRWFGNGVKNNNN